MKKILFGALLFSLAIASCKKNDVVKTPDIPASQLKLPPGKPVGPKAMAEIGPAGGVIKSVDGNLSIKVPAGAVDSYTFFTIEQVTNALESKGYSYRLRPDDITFKKDLLIQYYYGGVDLGATDPRMLFLAFQDKDGFYFSVNNTKGNRATKTLSAETRHFSDWTFYAKYDLFTEDLVNGKIYLNQKEQAKIGLVAMQAETEADPLAGLLAIPGNTVMRSAGWDYVSKTGSLQVNQLQCNVLYTAPLTVAERKELLVTCTLTGDLGKDNEGNKVGQLQLLQPVVLEPDSYFILTENGVDMPAVHHSAEFIQLIGTQAYASFANGYNLTLYTYGITGSFAYNQHGQLDAASIDLIPRDGEGYRTFRPENCSTGSTLFYSPGNVVITSVARQAGEYTEGHFTATVWKYNWCQVALSKSISGKFRVRM